MKFKRLAHLFETPNNIANVICRLCMYIRKMSLDQRSFFSDLHDEVKINFSFNNKESKIRRREREREREREI